VIKVPVGLWLLALTALVVLAAAGTRARLDWPELVEQSSLVEEPTLASDIVTNRSRAVAYHVGSRNVRPALEAAQSARMPDYVTTGARERYAFEEIVPLLKTPKLVWRFMVNNIEYDYGLGDRAKKARPAEEKRAIARANQPLPGREVYDRGIGLCHAHAVLQCTILERNGYDALVIKVPEYAHYHGQGRRGHSVCGVNVKGGKILVLDNAGLKMRRYDSLKEVFQRYGNHAGLQTIRASEWNRSYRKGFGGMEWTFHKVTRGVAGPPVVVSTWPKDGAVGVSRSLEKVTLTFSEPMTGNGCGCTRGLGKTRMSYDPKSLTWTLERMDRSEPAPYTTFEYEVNCETFCGESQTVFRDLEGTRAAPFRLSFTTGE
jgi:hypothetical protein